MSLVVYLTILIYRLVIPSLSIDEVCHVCRKACLDTFEKHAIHCKKLFGFKYRHEFVRDVIFIFLARRVRVSVKKECL